MTIHESLAPGPRRNRGTPAWRRGPLVLAHADVTLRELRDGDGPSLLAHLCRPTVQQYIAPSPASLDGLRRFIRWSRAQRRKGLYVCCGIVPLGVMRPVGVAQIWPIERDFSIAEWGMVLSDDYWGTGLFVSAADVLLRFAFDNLGVRRLEARAVDADARGNASLQKLGATREGVLRAGFQDGETVRDHVMWSILAGEWRARQGEARNGH